MKSFIIISIHNIEWLIDIGVYEHLTNNKNLLTNYVNKPKEFISVNATLCKFEISLIKSR